MRFERGFHYKIETYNLNIKIKIQSPRRRRRLIEIQKKKPIKQTHIEAMII